MERGKVVNPVAGKALAIGGISIYFQGWVGGWGNHQMKNKIKINIQNIQKNSNKTGKAFSFKRCSKDFITAMEVAHKPMTIQQQENKKTTKMF